MRYLGIALAAMTVTGCATQTNQNIVTAFCTADKLAPAVVQSGGTVATIVAPESVAAVAAANAADQAVHPLVQAACNSALPGSVPVAGTVNVTSVPVAPPVSQTTAIILPVSPPAK